MLQRKPAPPPEAPEPAPCRRRTCWRWVLLLAAVVVLLAAAAIINRATSPAAVKAMVLGQVRPYVNGAFGLDEARLRLPRDLRLKNVRGALKGGTQPDVTAEHVRLDLNPWALLSGETEIRAATVVRPTFRMAFRPDGSCTLVDLFDTPEWTTPSDVDDERDLIFGVRFEDGAVECRHAALFGDDRVRRLHGLHGHWQRWPSSMGKFDCRLTVRQPPFAGVRVRGAASLDRPWWVRLRADCDDLDFTAGLTDLLPAGIREVLSAFQLNGRLSGGAMLAAAADRSPDYDIRLRLAGGDLVWSRTGVRFEETSCALHVDPESASLRDLSAMLWDGLLTAQARVRFGPGGAARLTAWTQARDVQVAAIMKQFAPGQEPRPGKLLAEVRWVGDLRHPGKIEGTGTAELCEAAIAKLPFLAQVFARLNLSLAASEQIETGRARFRVDVQNRLVHLDRISVRSPNVLVSGRGWVSFGGELEIITVVALSRDARNRGVPILGDVVDFFVGGLQRAVTPPVRVYGRIGDKIETQLLPLQKIRKSFKDLLDLVPVPGGPRKQP